MNSVEITPAATAAQLKIQNLWKECMKMAIWLPQTCEQFDEVETVKMIIPSKVPEELFVRDEFCNMSDIWLDHRSGRRYVRNQQLSDIV